MSSERFAVNQQVYYNDTKRGWLRGAIFQLDKDKAEVESNADNNNNHNHGGSAKEHVIVPLRCIHGYIANSFDPHDADLFHVSDLHVATLLYCIKDRFEQLHQQYSIMGEMVLSVNPFQTMPYNTDAERLKYIALPDPRSLPPHIWQVAHKAFNAIFFREMGNQSIVISGESGSGKTENNKSLIAYLGQISNLRSNLSGQKSIAEAIDAALTWSNPIMESFGNARTVRNDNSSRFGKYIKLYFDCHTGVMVGGEVVTYLLERSRLIMQSAHERNYHIFYEMLAGLSNAEKMKLGNLKSATEYRCLNGGNTFTRRGVDGKTLNDANEFERVRRALTMINVSTNQEWCMLCVLASILHLMEVEFVADCNDKASIVNDQPMQVACNLLKLNCATLTECFLVKNRTELVTILSTVSEAERFRNAFCKALYVGLFDKLVEFVNASIKPHVDPTGCKYIGLLDIFGFENFTTNSFEQLCINYANEALQNHYNKYTFLNDEEECKEEGIPVPAITFPDNSECMNLFDEKPNGIFAMLDEECHFKGGNTARFTFNLWEYWKTAEHNSHFVQPKSTTPNSFGVKHYAAFVLYNTDDWLDKNTDALKEDMYTCIAESQDEFIRGLLSTEKSLNRRRQTVAIRFQRQLHDLRTELESTETQFIRCIKPNANASPNVLENELVGAQLESAGVLQTISLKRQGYPVRRPISFFCNYFYLIMPRTSIRQIQSKQLVNACCTMLTFYEKLYGWSTPHYAIGKNKVFLRAEVWSALERLVLRRRAQLQARCSPWLKQWIASFRERKRIEREKHMAYVKQMREERERKAAQYADGLSSEQMESVTTLVNTFPDVSLSTIMDIVAEAEDVEQAMEYILNIEEERTDSQSTSVLLSLLHHAQCRKENIDTLLSHNVENIATLQKIPHSVLKTYGLSEMEIMALNNELVQWKQTCKKCSDLRLSRNMSGNKYKCQRAIQMNANRFANSYEDKVHMLTEMGFAEKDAKMCLTHYNNDVERAAARLLYGYNIHEVHKRAQTHKPYTSLDSRVQRLLELRLSKTAAKAALRQCNGDMNKAVELIATLPTK